MLPPLRLRFRRDISRSIKALLEERREAVATKLLTAVASAAPISEIETIEKEHESVRAIERRVTLSNHPGWVLPLAIVAIAVFLFGIGVLIRVAPQLSMNANVTEVTFVAAGASAEFGSAEPIALTEIQVAGDKSAAKASKNAASIQSITVLPGTRVRVKVTGDHCFSILTSPTDSALLQAETQQEDDIKGLEFTVVGHPEAGSSTPMGSRLRVGSGVELYLCTATTLKHIITGPITELDVSHVFREGTPKILLSSITSGSLRTSQTAREIRLGDRDRFLFSGISDGWLVIFPAKELKIVFAGVVARADWVGISSSDREDLAPTLVDVAASSPWLKSLVGMFTGLVGVLWSVWRYFFSVRP